VYQSHIHPQLRIRGLIKLYSNTYTQSVTSRAVSIRAKDAILFPISANKTLTLETHVSGRGYYRIRIEFRDFTVATFESLGPFQLSPKNALGIDTGSQLPRDNFVFRPQSEGYDILVLFEETNTSGGTTFKSLPVHTLGANIISDDRRLSLTVTQSTSPPGICY